MMKEPSAFQTMQVILVHDETQCRVETLSIGLLRDLMKGVGISVPLKVYHRRHRTGAAIPPFQVALYPPEAYESLHKWLLQAGCAIQDKMKQDESSAEIQQVREEIWQKWIAQALEAAWTLAAERIFLTCIGPDTITLLWEGSLAAEEWEKLAASNLDSWHIPWGMEGTDSLSISWPAHPLVLNVLRQRVECFPPALKATLEQDFAEAFHFRDSDGFLWVGAKAQSYVYFHPVKESLARWFVWRENILTCFRVPELVNTLMDDLEGESTFTADLIELFFPDRKKGEAPRSVAADAISYWHLEQQALDYVHEELKRRLPERNIAAIIEDRLGKDEFLIWLHKLETAPHLAELRDVLALNRKRFAVLSSQRHKLIDQVEIIYLEGRLAIINCLALAKLRTMSVPQRYALANQFGITLTQDATLSVNERFRLHIKQLAENPAIIAYLVDQQALEERLSKLR